MFRLTTVAMMASLTVPLHAAEPEWQDVTNLEFWRATGDWYMAGAAKVSPDDPRRLVGETGEGVMINGKTGRTRDLYSKQNYRDVEISFEFMVPKGSNSGVKFMGLYEIQIEDSAHIEKPTGKNSGGIYPRAKLSPKYMHIDEGIAPKVNAAKAPGEWQTLHAIFRAPRFDESGEKIANARIDKAIMNGQVIHEDQELQWPTGHNWVKKEIPEGPIMLQADHGPIALKNIRIRPLDE